MGRTYHFAHDQSYHPYRQPAARAPGTPGRRALTDDWPAGAAHEIDLDWEPIEQAEVDAYFAGSNSQL